MNKSIINRLFTRLEKVRSEVNYKDFRRYYDIHPSFRFNGKDILFYGEGEIKIAENSYIGSYSTIQVCADHKVSIGRNVSIAHNVRVYTSSSETDQDFAVRPLRMKKGDVVIGDNVWIGVNAVITPGSRIGNNSVVGANSVVTRDIPANVVYGGVPARLIKEKTYEDAE